MHPHTNNWVERSKAIKRLRLRLQPVKEPPQQPQQAEAIGKEGKTTGSAAGGVTLAGGGDPYMRLEISKDHIDAISDFSELL